MTKNKKKLMKGIQSEYPDFNYIDNKSSYASLEKTFKDSIIKGNLNIVNKLLEIVSNDKIKRDMIHTDEYLAFRWAIENNHIDLMFKLIDNTHDIN